MTSRWLTGLGVLVIAAALFGCADPDQFGLRLTWTAGPTQACPRGVGGATSAWQLGCALHFTRYRCKALLTSARRMSG